MKVIKLRKLIDKLTGNNDLFLKKN